MGQFSKAGQNPTKKSQGLLTQQSGLQESHLLSPSHSLTSSTPSTTITAGLKPTQGNLPFSKTYSKNSCLRYAGHLFGAVAGLLLGIVLLENRKVERWETRLRAASISVYLGLLLITLLWHLVNVYSTSVCQSKQVHLTFSNTKLYCLKTFD